MQPVGWQPLAQLIGHPELADDPEWATPEARLPKLAKMFQLIEEWTTTLPKWQVLEELNRHNIPCGPILSTKEIINDESLKANEIVVEVDHPERGTYTTVGNPLKLSDSPTTIHRSPLLGEHNHDIYTTELGIHEDELPGLKAQGVI